MRKRKTSVALPEGLYNYIKEFCGENDLPITRFCVRVLEKHAEQMTREDFNQCDEWYSRYQTHRFTVVVEPTVDFMKLEHQDRQLIGNHIIYAKDSKSALDKFYRKTNITNERSMTIKVLTPPKGEG